MNYTDFDIIDNISDEEMAMISAMADEDMQEYFETSEAEKWIDEYKNNPYLM